jgi:hypothetical protein
VAEIFLIESSPPIAKHSIVDGVIDGQQDVPLMSDLDRDHRRRGICLPRGGFVFLRDIHAFFPCAFAERSGKIQLGCSDHRARALGDLNANSFPAALLETRRR